jgi:hypothetical protein
MTARAFPTSSSSPMATKQTSINACGTLSELASGLACLLGRS